MLWLDSVAAERLAVTSLQFSGTTNKAILSCLVQRGEAAHGQTLSALQLYGLQQELQEFCLIQKGYPTSQVVLPAQQVDDGVLTFRVLLGYVQDIQVKAPPEVVRQIRSFLQPIINQPLHQPRLAQALQRIEQEPYIDSVHALIQPAASSASQELTAPSAVLLVSPKLKDKGQLSLQLDNYRPVSLGEWGVSLNYQRANALVLSDQFSTTLGVGEGVNSVLARYKKPITARWSWFSNAEWQDTEVVEQPFNRLDIATQTYGLKAGLQYNWLLDSHRDMHLSAAYEYRHAQSSLLGQPFSFSDGPENGKSAIHSLNVNWNYAQAWLRSGYLDTQLLLNSDFVYGMDVFDATAHADDRRPDGQFLQWRGHGQLKYWLPSNNVPDWYVSSALRAQWANRPLLPIQKFSLGGNSTVRGYRENTLVRDQGLVASVALGKSFMLDGTGRGRVTAELFYDYGVAKNRVTSGVTSSDSIRSVGLGFKWRVNSALKVKLDLAHGLTRLNQSDKSLQNDGVHLSVNYALGSR